MENAVAKIDIVSQKRRIRVEQMLNNLARFAPGRAAQRKKFVERILAEQLSIQQFRLTKMTELFQDR